MTTNKHVPVTTKLISVVSPCYNEEDNVEELYRQVKQVFADLPTYRYEHIFIDNASTDKTVSLLKQLAAQDSNVKIIINNRNFGHIRSPYYGLLQANGDAIVMLVSDLQDPPAMIKDFIHEWENGWKIVVGVKNKTEESFLMRHIRRAYYRFVARISDITLIKDFMGYGLYDRDVIEALRSMDESYPYFRGLICETGYEIKQLYYQQQSRKRGITKNNFYTLYDMAMLGITSHSTVPLRLATMMGFSLSGISLLLSLVFLVLKLIFWNDFSLGIAPVLIGLFFFASIQLFFIGILGEYLVNIQIQVTRRPLVFEKERINFTL